MADFVDELKKVYKLQKELDALEGARNAAHSAAGQAIALKQAEVTKARRAASDAA